MKEKKEITKKAEKIVLVLILMLLILQFSCNLVLNNAAYISQYVRFNSQKEMINYFAFITKIVKITPILEIILGIIYAVLYILNTFIQEKTPKD